MLVLWPPLSTLFPYTTLFRSQWLHAGAPYLREHERLEVAQPVFDRRGVDRNRLRSDSVDRKSTRLNSSHANISYAVFCLKKKKTRKCGTACGGVSKRLGDQPA